MSSDMKKGKQMYNISDYEYIYFPFTNDSKIYNYITINKRKKQLAYSNNSKKK